MEEKLKKLIEDWEAIKFEAEDYMEKTSDGVAYATMKTTAKVFGEVINDIKKVLKENEKNE